MVEMDLRGILAREYRRADYQSHANPHFRSFPAASFPLCKYSRTGWCIRARTAVLFYFLPSVFLENVQSYRKCLSIIELN
jgi:hypothetical protein